MSTDLLPARRTPDVLRSPSALTMAPLPADRLGVGVRTNDVATATTTNVAASTTTTVVSPPRAAAIPPRGDPTRRAIAEAAVFAEFAWTSCSVATIRGTSANDAGSLTCCSSPCTPVTTNAGKMRSAVTASNGSKATA